MTNERILIVDDESDIVHLCTRMLTEKGYAVEGITNGREAIARLEAETRSQGKGFHLLVVDIKMPDVDGLTVLRQGRELDPHLGAVVITGYGTMKSAVEALHAGAQRFVLKPFEHQDFLVAVEEALAQRRKEQERLRLRAQLPILEISQALMAEDDLEFLTERLLGVVARQMRTDQAVLVLPAREKGEWRVAGLVGECSDAQGASQPNLWRDLRWERDVSDTVLASGGEIAIALRCGKKTIGLLDLKRFEGDFTPSDRDLLTIMAGQIATALENARLYQAVTRAEREWAETFDAITGGISIHDAEFCVVRANSTLSDWLGIPPEELVGQTCYTLFHQGEEPPDFCPLAEAMVSGQPHTVEVEEPVLGGMFQTSTYPLIDEDGEVTGAVHIMQDITERKQMEKQLIQSEKLAALGRLAASLAHEINNPLQALRSGLGLLIKGSHKKEKRQQYLQVANREVERLIAITDRMLNFYRPSAEQRKLIDVNDILDEVLTLAGKKLQHSRVSLSLNLERHLPPIEAVADHLWQVFLNIVLNALDAMPEGGELTVTSGFNSQREEVWISFADTGKGIATEDMSRIFEPLYSTKPRGTGLGLAISYGIVERHNGRMEVQSEVDKGSTFTVFLPAKGFDPTRGQEIREKDEL